MSLEKPGLCSVMYERAFSKNLIAFKLVYWTGEVGEISWDIREISIILNDLKPSYVNIHEFPKTTTSSCPIQVAA